MALRRASVRGAPSTRTEGGEQASGCHFGIGGAHDLAHYRDAARSRLEAGGEISFVDATERDDRAGGELCRLSQRIEPDRRPVAGLAPRQKNRAQRRVIGARRELRGNLLWRM